MAFSLNQITRKKIVSKQDDIKQCYFYVKTNSLLTENIKIGLWKYVDYRFKSRNRGTTIPSLVKSDLLSIDVPFISSIKEQQTIVRQLDALRAETQKLEAVYQKKIADLEELKKSILQKAFAGELKTSQEVV